MKQSIGLTLALTVTCLVVALWQFVPLDDAKERLHALPLRGSSYSGQSIALTPSERAFFGETPVLKRVYRVKSQSVFVTMIDGSKKRSSVHDPYYCFTGSGWIVESKQDYPLSRGVASLLTLTKQGTKRQALFWFSDGERQFASPLQFWLATSIRRITLGYYSDEPVLVAIQPMGIEDVDWDVLFKGFPELAAF